MSAEVAGIGLGSSSCHLADELSARAEVKRLRLALARLWDGPVLTFDEVADLTAQLRAARERVTTLIAARNQEQA